jgi:hypothetical protein
VLVGACLSKMPHSAISNFHDEAVYASGHSALAVVMQ